MEIMLTIILILQVVILFHLQYDRIVGILRRKFPDKTANAQKVNAKNPVKYRNLADKPLLKVVVEHLIILLVIEEMIWHILVHLKVLSQMINQF